MRDSKANAAQRRTRLGSFSLSLTPTAWETWALHGLKSSRNAKVIKAWGLQGPAHSVWMEVQPAT